MNVSSCSDETSSLNSYVLFHGGEHHDVSNLAIPKTSWITQQRPLYPMVPKDCIRESVKSCEATLQALALESNQKIAAAPKRSSAPDAALGASSVGVGVPLTVELERQESTFSCLSAQHRSSSLSSGVEADQEDEGEAVDESGRHSQYSHASHSHASGESEEQPEHSQDEEEEEGSHSSHQQQQQDTPSSGSSTTTPSDPWLEIVPGFSVPYVGTAAKTRKAIRMQHAQAITRTTCLGCQTELICMVNVEFVLCVVCHTASPLPKLKQGDDEDNCTRGKQQDQDEESDDDTPRGAGIGLLVEELERTMEGARSS
ncbi:expressed unknown protein [Seminavis robusta]|uniref:Uncharacterized protein n=1 Tax=Seminavis robusta TaxID=568900 RepID=A0A9N8E960_9STRA|nr:expressed unknown protein [Seminavis robusta]|eukprot:Sro685_g186980.1 n/a (314) ;mRNA; r:50662-51603